MDMVQDLKYGLSCTQSVKYKLQVLRMYIMHQKCLFINVVSWTKTKMVGHTANSVFISCCPIYSYLLDDSYRKYSTLRQLQCAAKLATLGQAPW